MWGVESWSEHAKAAVLAACIISLVGMGMQMVLLPGQSEPGWIESIGFVVAAVVSVSIYVSGRMRRES